MHVEVWQNIPITQSEQWLALEDGIAKAHISYIAWMFIYKGKELVFISETIN